MGAHVWWPAYLRDHLLPWRVAGWSPDFYAGFPAGQFYFPVPALMIIGLDVVIPYNVAFKLDHRARPGAPPDRRVRLRTRTARAEAHTGSVRGRVDVAAVLHRRPRDLATPPRRSRSTSASWAAPSRARSPGEYSFTIAVAFALLFLGALAMALRSRHHLWAPCGAPRRVPHEPPGRRDLRRVRCARGLAVPAPVEELHARRRDRRRRRAPERGVGPPTARDDLVHDRHAVRDDRRAGVDVHDRDAGPVLHRLPVPQVLLRTARLAAVPLGRIHPHRRSRSLPAVGFLRRSTFTLLVLTALCGLAFRFWSELGTHVWNLRLLSFWYLGIHLMMAIGVAELIRGAGWLAGRGWRLRGASRRGSPTSPTTTNPSRRAPTS